MILPTLCLVVAAAPAWSQASVSFEAQLDSIQRVAAVQRAASVQAAAAAATELDALLAVLRDGKEPAEQLAALETLAQRAGGLASADQFRVVEAVRAAADSSFKDASVRAKALRTLGKMMPWLFDDSAKTKAVQALVDAASVAASDSRFAFRAQALYGLADCAKSLPFGGDSLAESVAGVALDSLRDSMAGQERMVSILLLHNFLGGNGAGVFWRDAALGRRAEQELIVPLEGHVDPLYVNSTTDYRYLYVRVLFLLSGLSPDGQSVRTRVCTALQDISQREPDTTIRLLARSYAERLQR